MYIVILFFICFSSLASAVDIPLDFLYKDQMIDPNCILESNTSHTIDLAECSKHKGKLITHYIINNNTYGYRFLDGKNSNFPSSIAYEYLGKIKDLHVVHAFIIGTEIGRLSYINYLKINKGILKLIKRGPSGDRSFGGIYNAKLKYGTLSYDMALTPKLFMLYFNKDESLKPVIENLPDCAVCQFSLLHFENEKIKSVTLNSTLSKKPHDQTTQCFNTIHQKYIDYKKLNLNLKEVNYFIKSFVDQCIKP